jgi:uncharacterized protein YicC (UPF0701 family)
MKMTTVKVLLCVVVSLSIGISGCRKKDSGAKEGSGGEGTSSLNLSALKDTAAEKAKEAAERAPEVVAAAKEKITNIASMFQADEGKSVEEITAQAREMAADKLREMSQLYRDKIALNQETLKGLAEKWVKIPDTEKLSAEALKLKEDIDKIKTGLDGLAAKFQVYVAALKEKGGNITGLDI